MFNKKNFDNNCYALVKSQFSEEEINDFRIKAEKQLEEDESIGGLLKNNFIKAKLSKSDLLSKTYLKEIIMHDSIITLAKEALGSDEIVYFGDSTCQYGVGFRGFHRDNIDREYNSGPDWEGEYPLVRIGVYLQNHKNYSGGLKVRKGSHLNKSGKAVFLDSEIGDVAIWNLKTLHSGNAVRLKIFPSLSVNKFEKHIPTFLKKKEDKERISLFMTFATKSIHLDRYLSEYIYKLDSNLERIKASPITLEDKAFMENTGVEILCL